MAQAGLELIIILLSQLYKFCLDGHVLPYRLQYFCSLTDPFKWETEASLCSTSEDLVKGEGLSLQATDISHLSVFCIAWLHSHKVQELNDP